MHKALSIIREEHRSLAAVLSGLCEIAHMACRGDLRPQFDVFRAMIYYIDTFPEREHHPKEDDHLFAKLLERDPGARPLIDKLKAEHMKGARLVRELERALHELEMVWPRGAEEFNAAANAYAQFHWNHMRTEEDQLLPRAERALTGEDWRAIEAAFTANTEPLAGLQHTDFKALYQRILHLAPDPVGLGDRWKKSA
jgi:hemerythrin-like domain-containing protein